MKQDVQVWNMFLESTKIYCRPFIDLSKDISVEDKNIFSDVPCRWTKGFGALCQEGWMFRAWDTALMSRIKPHIEYLELYEDLAAVLTWIRRFKNQWVYLFCVHMINRSTSTCRNCKVLIRLLTLKSLKKNLWKACNFKEKFVCRFTVKTKYPKTQKTST